MKKVVLAFDSFKGSVSSKEITQTLQRAISSEWEDIDVVSFPIADGGEGTVQFLPVVPGLGDRADAVVVQAEHADQAEDIADRPGLGIQTDAVCPDRAGKIRRRDKGKQHREEAVGDVVRRVLPGAHKCRIKVAKPK